MFALALVGLAMGVAGSMQQASAAKKAARQNRAAAYMQADMLGKQAEFAKGQGTLRQADLDTGAMVVQAKQRASFAAQGVDLNSSVVQMAGDETQRVLQRDKDRLQLAAGMEAWGLKAQATLTRKQGAVTASGQTSQANAQLLGSVGQYGLQAGQAYQQYKTT